MAHDRLTEVRIQGLRTLADVKLPLDGLTVLIGENGSGKSSLIEALELLRCSPDRSFLQEVVHQVHSAGALLRHGESSLVLGVLGELGNPKLGPLPFEYEFELRRLPSGFLGIARERLTILRVPGGIELPMDVLNYNGRKLCLMDFSKGDTVEEEETHTDHLFISRESLSRQLSGEDEPDPDSPPPLDRIVKRVADLLRGIQAHVAFDTMAEWASRRLNRQSLLRETPVLAPVAGVGLGGFNLANTLYALKNDLGKQHWDETMDYLRLGLEELRDVTFPPDPAGGKIGFRLEFEHGLKVPLFGLSDGQLAYIAHVALARVAAVQQGRVSLLAFDEPETHLHPGLLLRVLGLYEELARSCPVILATHSDRLLDALTDPAKCVRVTDLDEGNRTRLLRLDRTELDGWLAKYRGFGELRAAGYEGLLTRPADQ